MFSIIFKEIQADFERQAQNIKYIPQICGICGRACRQMNRAEGANRALCQGCDLCTFAESQQAQKLNYYDCETLADFGHKYGFYNPIDAARFLKEKYEEDVLWD